MSCCFFPPGAVYEDHRKKWVPGFTVGPLHNTKWRYISSLLDFGCTKQEVTYPDAITESNFNLSNSLYLFYFFRLPAEDQCVTPVEKLEYIFLTSRTS